MWQPEWEGSLGRMEIYIHIYMYVYMYVRMAESLHCSPRTVTILLTAILKYKIKSLKNRIYEKLFWAAQTEDRP